MRAETFPRMARTSISWSNESMPSEAGNPSFHLSIFYKDLDKKIRTAIEMIDLKGE